MKKITFQKTMAAAMLFLVISGLMSPNDVLGQNCPATVKGKASARGCTEATAQTNLTSEISAKSALVCPRRSCNPLTNNCYLNQIITIGVPDCKPVRDRTCPNNQAWECKQDYEVDCLCRPRTNPAGKTGSDEDYYVMEKPLPPGALAVFPSPAANQITINLRGYNGKAQLLVFSVIGEQMIRIEIEAAGEYLFPMDVSFFPKGIYKVVLTKDSGIEQGTFSKE